ncbi:MAG: cytochrome c3 family protein, partial [Candidatus Zixiibacteriota bacterium]
KLMAKKYLPLVIGLSLLAFVIASISVADTTKVAAEKVKHEYVGADKCKYCHKKDGVHPSWLETKHAKAWENLKPEQQKDEKCIGCHSTGTTAKGVLLEGVQCEACHGPGDDYRKKSIMENRELAIEKGLLIPDEKTCLKCHNENVPEEFRSKEKFDFEKMKAKGVHTLAQKVEEKKTE